jgi:hypothetical protein
MLTIITLPITWFSHLWNLFIPMSYFRDEDYRESKLSFLNSMGIHFFLLVFGVWVGKGMIDIGKNGGYDYLFMSDSIMLTYTKLMLTGILSLVFLGILVCVFVAIAHIFIAIKRKIVVKIKNIRGKTDIIDKTAKTPSNISRVIKSIKDKHCIIIDWSEIRENN